MAKESPSSAAPPSETVRVAKISALQAVIVALIAGAAGVASTAGLKYVEHSNELAHKDQQLAELDAKRQREVRVLNDQLHESVATSSLLTATTRLSQTQCVDKVAAALKAAVPGGGSYFASELEPGNTGSRAWLGAFKVRFVCDPAAHLLVVSVAAIASAAETNRVAQAIVAALQDARKGATAK